MIKCKKCNSLFVAENEATDEYECTNCGHKWSTKEKKMEKVEPFLDGVLYMKEAD